ncbi:sulfatase-like hydrolase/transferase [Achromobacter spanius]|uniref:sulfatase-like hydrolase/transferase n=1 Tax=Achromobacter spanius TaxID=217203 RepID=UPI0036E48C95
MKGKNIVVIMSDEHNPAFMGCSGHPFIKTPNLDALAARGTRFPNAYTPSPICVPARAAFATGHRVHQTRHWDNAMPYVGDPQGWGHVLQQQGISVESIGKLHYRNEADPVGFDAEHIPMHVVGGHGMVWASIRDPYLPVAGRKRMLGDRIGMGESPYTSYDRSVTDRSLEWLRAAADRGEPFVLYVGLVAPHFPLIAPREFFDLYEARRIPHAKLHPKDGYERHPWVQAYAEFERSEDTFESEDERVNAFLAYYGLCSFLDSNVGRIVDALDALGLADSTHVVYTSDHGDNVGARGLWGKSTLYQESVGIPMILAGPDVSPSVCDTSVDLLDLYPTILQAVGVDPTPHMGTRQGLSLFDIARQPVDDDRAILSEYHAAGSNTAGFMLRKGPWKYHHYVRFQPELFNLESDPGELHDLAGEPAYAAVLAGMKAALYAICNPEDVDRQAKADQAALIERMGGPEAASTMGSSGATPAPKVEQAA